MRIAVIGAGAMGSIYGGHLSQHNEVILVDTNQQVVEQINKMVFWLMKTELLSPISPRLFVIHQKKSLLIW